MWGLLLFQFSLAGLDPVPHLAQLIGTTEPALKLLISIFMGYPLAIFYHKYVKKYQEFRNLYFAIAGLDIAYYNFGISMYHNALPAIVFYFTTKFLEPGKLNTLITFIFNMTYLLVGYVVTESENYDITWTMPQCVLALKLIALAFDLQDGFCKTGRVRHETLTELPSYMELIGFVYFPACFLVGPIFSFRRYRDFVMGFYPLEGEAKRYQKLAFERLLQGVGYLVAFQVGGYIFNNKYMQSDEFLELNIFYRHLYCGMWAHFALYKYIACWLLTESSCIRIGFSYNGLQKLGEGKTVTKWDACNNIKLIRFETATKFQHYIESFNCNTNFFASEYIYKRLKFLGNRQLSQLFTLLFLAMWHGTRSGYYVTFFNEFLIIYMEKELESILVGLKLYDAMWSYRFIRYILYGLLKLYTIVFMGWSLVPFDVKAFSKWWSIYYSLWFSGFVLFLPWGLVYKPLLKKIVKLFKTKEQ